MKTLASTFLLTVLLSFSQSAFSQDNSLKTEVDPRKAEVLTFMEEVLDLDERTQKMVAAMVDVYIQSIVRTARQMPLNDRSRQVYLEIKRNHLQLLGNYLTEEQLDIYQKAVLQDADGTVKCAYCDSPKKKEREHCMFCGHLFSN
jgi:hypothetical protein